MSYQERLRPNSLSLQDALRGQLPTIDVIEQHYADMVSRSASPQQRAEMLIKAGQRYETGLLKIDPASETFGADVISCLFIDAVTILSHSQLADLAIPDGINESNSGRRARFRGHVLKKIESKRDFQRHIQDYAEAFEGADDYRLLEGLRAIMHEAKCLLGDDAEITAGRIGQARGELIGMLAEYKVLTALRAWGWEFAAYASAEEDLAQIDIKLPFVADRKLESLAIQVKAKKGQEPGLEIEQTPEGLTIHVPMFDSSLSLSQEEASQLTNAVLARLDMVSGVALSFSGENLDN